MQKNNIVKAVNKNVRCSPRKISLLLNYIKGKKADKALRDLDFSKKRIAHDVSKTVKSAISNAPFWGCNSFMRFQNLARNKRERNGKNGGKGGMK